MTIGVCDDAALVLRVVNANDVAVFGKPRFHLRKIGFRHLETNESDTDVMGLIGLLCSIGVVGLRNSHFNTVGADNDTIVNIEQTLKTEVLFVPRKAAFKVAHYNSNGVQFLRRNHCFAPLPASRGCG